MASHVARLRATCAHSVVVSAGDLIGATPLLSSLYHDEPTIEAMNRLGLEIGAVGNHEFDDGMEELLRMRNGGCHPTDAAHTCQGGSVGTPVPFGGAAFDLLSANVTDGRTGRTLLPPWVMREFEGIKVAFIGMTLEGTSSIVTPSAVAGLEFHDEAETANALVPEIRKRGAEAIVVLLHQGGATTGDMNECPGMSGPIVDIVAALDDAVDLVISGHTHRAYVCSLPNRAGRAIPVTSAGSFGRLLTEIDLRLDRRTRDVIAAAATNRVVAHDGVEPAPDLTALVERYRALAAPMADRTIGAVEEDIVSRGDGPRSPLGELIADAQLEATKGPDRGGAVAAFTNPGSVRGDLLYEARGAEGNGTVTRGEVFDVQPFGNTLVTMTLTGRQIYALLDQQWQGQPNVLQVSSSLGYEYTVARSGEVAGRDSGPRVCPGSVRIGGTPLEVDRGYRVTVNSYLAEGGDGFDVLKEGGDRRVGVEDLAALEAYLAAQSPVSPPAPGRVRQVERCR
jgi:5'-nucleotidase